ncbi:MAG: 2-C-methyl-D-erythritol 4-phosphate cytidylyltransferase [candidate division Zixibacteria bacterium]|nr:2-C-methyl-D-erythritol 4-phosphate cytidylyltransferase [candidate division Zixibacteria bacterium]
MGDKGPNGARVVAVVLAAGSSERMEGRDKIYAPLGGRPLIYYSLALFEECAEVDAVIVVAAAGSENETRAVARDYGLAKIREVVAGGVERRDSAAAGLSAATSVASPGAAVLIHDAARPFASKTLVRRLLEALVDADGAVPAIRPADTVKRVAEERDVVATLARDVLRLVQTPQAFKLGAIAEAYRVAVRERWPVTDDAAVLEQFGGRVVTVEGERDNFKITYPQDLAFAELVLARKGAGP